MKLLSGAVLFFALIGSSLLAFDQAGKKNDNDNKKAEPENWSISGFRPIPSSRKSISAF